MNDIKKEFRWFSIMDYEKEAEYLSKRQQEGWKFLQVKFPGIYTFEKCNPENVTYQLDYNKADTENHDDYVRMFEDCGWEYVLTFYGYSYFRKPAADMCKKEEIFCDDESRLDMMKRIFAGRVIPLIIIFCCLLINGYYTIVNHDNLSFTIVFAVLTVLYAILFIQFAVKYFAFKNKVRAR